MIKSVCVCLCVYSLVYGEKVDVYWRVRLGYYVNNRDGVEQM